MQSVPEHYSHWGYVSSSLSFKLLLSNPINRASADISETPTESTLAWSNALLSIPTARLFSSDASTGPILASHFYDIQSSTSYLSSSPNGDAGAGSSHTGAPTVNVEVVLRGVVEVVSGEKPKEGNGGSEVAIEGALWARGPTLGERISKGGEPVKEG